MGQVEGSRRDVRPKVSDAARPGDWDDGHSMYLLSMMHPGQCDLPRCGLVRSGDFLQRSGPRGCGSHTMKQSVTCLTSSAMAPTVSSIGVPSLRWCR